MQPKRKMEEKKGVKQNQGVWYGMVWCGMGNVRKGKQQTDWLTD